MHVQMVRDKLLVRSTWTQQGSLYIKHSDILSFLSPRQRSCEGI